MGIRASTVRTFALSLPDAEERETWDTATFRVRNKIFVMEQDRQAHASFKASPMTQALEVPDTRARLAAELSLVGHPQMVLRIGRALQESTTTGGHANRLPVEDVLQCR